MIKIDSKLVFEILFLNRHPNGPKMSVKEIANRAEISEKAVEICLEKFENCDIFQVDEVEKVSANAENLDHTIELMKDELKSVSLCTWPSMTSLHTSMSEEKENKVPSDKFAVDFNKFMKLCETDLYDKLEKTLSINRSSVTIKGTIKKLYAVENFSEQRHNIIMKQIDVELRYKNKVQPLKVYDTYTGNDTSLYTVEVSMERLKIQLEEILEDPSTLEGVGGIPDKLIWIKKVKWITICKNEWYEKVEAILAIGRAELRPLDGLVNQLYSIDVFNDQNHENMMKAVDRQFKIKERVQQLKFSSGSNQSYYTASVAAKDFELALEDILDATMNNSA